MSTLLESHSWEGRNAGGWGGCRNPILWGSLVRNPILWGFLVTPLAWMPRAPPALPAQWKVTLSLHFLCLGWMFLKLQCGKIWAELRHGAECFLMFSSFKEDGYRKGKTLIFIGPEVLFAQSLFAQSSDTMWVWHADTKVWAGSAPGLLSSEPQFARLFSNW